MRMRIEGQGIATLGILVGTYLASVGAVAVTGGIAERDARGALGLVPLFVGGLLLIASTRSHRRPGARGTFLRLPWAVDVVARVLVVVSMTLHVVWALFILLVSDALLVASPEWQADHPLPPPAWPMLLELWLWVGAMLAYLVLNLVLVWSMRLVVVAGLISGFVVAVAGVGHMATPNPIAPFVALAGLVAMVASIARWRRQRRPDAPR
jgi:hypothetical protein